jgi:hypothetical protein
MNKSEKMYDCVVYFENVKKSREKKEVESRMFSTEESTVNYAGNDLVKKRYMIYSKKIFRNIRVYGLLLFVSIYNIV